MSKKKCEIIPYYTLHYQQFFEKASKNDFMIDVGANVGFATLPVADLGYRVIAFEPVPSNIAILTKSLERNNFQKNVTVIPFALSSLKGKQEIHIPKGRADNASLNYDAAVAGAKHNNIETSIIETITFDEWWNENKEGYAVENARLMKIDVQGWEEAVLKGAIGFLKEAKKYGKLIVEFEYNPDFLRVTNTKPDYYNFLKDLGYSLDIRPGSGEVNHYAKA